MSSLLLNLLFPPRCAGCDELIPVSDWRRGEECLCRDCRAAWELSKLATCSECGEAMMDCRCMPRQLEESGMQALCKLSGYGTDTEDQRTVANRLVYCIKDRHVIAYERFVAEQLASVVRAELQNRGWLLRREDGTMPFETVVTYCPRSVAMKRKTGTDQAERIARRLAKKLELPYMPLFVRRDSVEQKRLSGQERQTHAKMTYRLRRNASVRVKRVILVDDIVTTGASMAACTEVLIGDGALSVIGVAVERVNRKKRKKQKNT